MTKGATQTQKFKVKSFRTFRSSPFLKLCQQSSECLLSFGASFRKILDDVLLPTRLFLFSLKFQNMYCCYQDVSSSYFSIFSHGFCREPCRSHKSIWKKERHHIYLGGSPFAFEWLLQASAKHDTRVNYWRIEELR